MVAALQMLSVYLMEMLSLQRKMVAAGLVQYSPLFFVLVRFYGMLQMRAKGKALDWDWQDWLEDIDDDLLRLKLRVALESDAALCPKEDALTEMEEALRKGGLPVTLAAQSGAGHLGSRRHEANRAC